VRLSRRPPPEAGFFAPVAGSWTPEMASRNERIAEVEVLFRAGNERVMAWPENQERAALGETLMAFCECGNRRCREHVHLTGLQYEAVRADPRRFIVMPGHDFPEAEDVVEVHESYVVVEKHEDVAELVERMDVRRRVNHHDP
jgi:hypothetical protein